MGSLGLDGCGSGSPKVKRALHRGGHFGCLLPLLAVSQFQRIQMLVNLLLQKPSNELAMKETRFQACTKTSKLNSRAQSDKRQSWLENINGYSETVLERVDASQNTCPTELR